MKNVKKIEVKKVFDGGKLILDNKTLDTYHYDFLLDGESIDNISSAQVVKVDENKVYVNLLVDFEQVEFLGKEFSKDDIEPNVDTARRLFKTYSKRKNLLSKFKLESYDYQPEDQILLRRMGEVEDIDSNLLGVSQELRVVISKIVDDFEETIIEHIFNTLPAVPFNQIELEDLKEYDSGLNFNMPFNLLGIYREAGITFTSCKDRYTIKEPYVLLTHSEKSLGKIGIYRGESIDGVPKLWFRKVDNLIQVGIGFNILYLDNCLLIKS